MNHFRNKLPFSSTSPLRFFFACLADGKSFSTTHSKSLPFSNNRLLIPSSPNHFSSPSISRSFTSIPVIDVGPLVKKCIIDSKLENQITKLNSFTMDSSSFSEQEYVNSIQKLHDACQNVGFFYASGHGVSESLTKDVLKISRHFFSLSEEEKQKISIRNSPIFRGYQKLGENVTEGSPDWHEAIDFYKEFSEHHHDVIVKKPLHGPNQWPSSPPEFRPIMENYVNSMKILGKSIMRGMAVALGMPDATFEGDRAGDPFWVLRVIGYPPIPSHTSSQSTLSCGEHTDYGLLTLITQDEGISALQVRNREGEWVLADPIPHTFVVNIGNMLNIWTNGIYEATPHRVLNTNKTYRVSVPFFYEPNFDAIVEPLEPCLKGKLESKFKPIVYGDHLVKKVYNNFSL